MPAPKRPRDPNQLAKLITDIATGEKEEAAPPAGQSSDQPRGRTGGIARASTLSPPQRKKIAQRAAAIRWKAKADEQA